MFKFTSNDMTPESPPFSLRDLPEGMNKVYSILSAVGMRSKHKQWMPVNKRVRLRTNETHTTQWLLLLFLNILTKVNKQQRNPEKYKHKLHPMFSMLPQWMAEQLKQ